MENPTFHGTIVYVVSRIEYGGYTKIEVPVSASTKENLISAMKDVSDEVMQNGLKTEHEDGFTFYPPHTIMSISAEY